MTNARGSAAYCQVAYRAAAQHLRHICAWVILIAFGIFAAAYVSNAQSGVLTQHNDNSRSGLNSSETVLTSATVNVNQFGKLFAVPVDGEVYAQPLYVPNVSFPGNITHNVLVVATENDTMYAFDADSATGTPLWTASLVDAAHGATAGETALNVATTIGCSDISPEVGITGTPVIDMNTLPSPTIYVEAKSVSGYAYFHRLHALDITNGNEKAQGPVVIMASVNAAGSGSINGILPFSPETQLNRAGLLLLNGIVYIGFGAHCDTTPYHGWIFAYDAATFTQESVFITTPDTGLGAIWMSGTGLAADSNGYMYVATGNGYIDANPPFTSFGDSILKLSTVNGNQANGYLSLTDYFTPYDQSSMLQNDEDLGSGGVLLLPDQLGTSPHVLVEASKDGRIYLLNRDQFTSDPSNPGQPEHYCSTCTGGDPQILQETSSSYMGAMFGVPAYWNNRVYFGGAHDVLRSIPLSNGVLNFAGLTSSTSTFGFPGPTPSISSNGVIPGTAILWVISGTGIYAYNAENLSQLLWTSTLAADGRDQAGPYVKFSVPTIINGKVFVGATSEVDVYGLLPQAGQGQVPQLPADGSNGVGSTPGSDNPPASANSATFLSRDNTTQGTWQTIYGPDGYSLASSLQSLPSYATFSLASQDSQYVWANPTGDARGLLVPPAGSSRIASTWYSSTTPLNANVTVSGSHVVSIYLIDWDSQGRAETVQVLDGTTSAVLDTETVSSFTGGVWLSWTVSGSVQISAKQTTGPNAVISGVFFGTPATPIPAANAASFLSRDTATQGTWESVYGPDGYSIAGSSPSLPSYASLSILSTNAPYTWSDPTSDVRGLEIPPAYTSRTASTWYASATPLVADINVIGSHVVSIYVVDWDSRGRAETIQVLDGATSAVLDTETVSLFTGGAWLSWNVAGHVAISVRQTAGPNAVMSGVFFGTPGSPVSPPISSGPGSSGLSSGTNSGSNASGLSVIPSALPGGTVGDPYTTQLAVSGGVSPYSWQVVGGFLPAGLTLSQSGILSGTPIASTVANFYVWVRDSTGARAEPATPFSVAIH